VSSQVGHGQAGMVPDMAFSSIHFSLRFDTLSFNLYAATLKSKPMEPFALFNFKRMAMFIKMITNHCCMFVLYHPGHWIIQKQLGTTFYDSGLPLFHMTVLHIKSMTEFVGLYWLMQLWY
jgi:hypothetical protein